MQKNGKNHHPNHPNARRIGFLRKLLQREKLTGSTSWKTFSTNLKSLNRAMTIDVDKTILQDMHQTKDPNYRVIELGAGDGTASSELKQAIPGLHLTATGLTKRKEWEKHSNHSEIRWVTVEFQGLSKKIKPNSMNFAFSCLGIENSQSMRETFAEIHKILKPGGKLLYLYRAPFPGGLYVPQGFKPVRKHAAIYSEEPDPDSPTIKVVGFIEKI